MLGALLQMVCMNSAHNMQTSAQPEKMLTILNLRRKAKEWLVLDVYHFKGTDSVSSLDDLQDNEMFDQQSDTLDNFAMKTDITWIEMQQEIILANQLYFWSA